MKRGEIWWASLEGPRGSELGFRRPIVIISSDAFNDSAINTVLAAVITSNTRLADAPGNIRLSKCASKLSKESVINISQIITVDKTYLDERVSKLNQQFLGSLDEGLALVMGL